MGCWGGRRSGCQQLRAEQLQRKQSWGHLCTWEGSLRGCGVGTKRWGTSIHGGHQAAGASPSPNGPAKGPSLPVVLLRCPPCPTQTRWLCPHRGQERPHQASTATGELGCPAVPLPTGPDASLSPSWQLSEGKMMERRKKIALELSELVVYCRPVPFDEESEHLLVSCHRRQTPWCYRPRCVPPGCCPGLWLACS